jgi:predicted cupin superfamily sugar epimerase
MIDATTSHACASVTGIDPGIQELIERFGMAPLPVEGTLFAQTYASGAVTPAGDPAGTAGIGLFANEPPSRSLFHRLDFDELWHFYAGDPLRLVLLHPDGTHEEVILDGVRIQHLIPAGVWQAGEVAPGGSWSLYGVTMAPGFTPTCFEGGRTDELLARYPNRAADIERLAIPPGDPVTMPA